MRLWRSAPSLRLIPLVAVSWLISSCSGAQPDENPSSLTSNLNQSERRKRAGQIRDAAAEAGLNNALLLGGIASAETGMAQCWSEATWACQGPSSADCDGGPVIAGAADGPCSIRQGGLGIFQFDAGTFDQTLAREGERILSIAGNVQAGIDFVAAMVVRSKYIEDVDTREQALGWMNRVRAYNDLWVPWIQTVTHYYNGCVPGSCSIYEQRFDNYSDRTTELISEMGADFWYGRAPGCGPLPKEGGVLDETDYCFGAGGDPDFWRHEAQVGHDAELLWTYATAAAQADNWAFWQIRLSEAGQYRLEAFTDAAFAGSQRADYEVTHAAATEHVVINQAAVNGWAEIGTFEFTAGGEQRVRLGDNTGEPVGDERRLVTDAIRLTRVDGPVDVPTMPIVPVEPILPTDPSQPPVAMPTAPTAQPAAPGAEPGVGIHAQVSADAAGGCSTTGTRGNGEAAALLVFALGALRKRGAKR
jgi:hypothetical protein